MDHQEAQDQFSHTPGHTSSPALDLAPQPERICRQTRQSFSAYLDGAVSGVQMQSVAAHLDACPACTEDFAAWRGMQRTLTAMGQRRAPADLGLKLRLAISHEAARREGRDRDRWLMQWENFIRPMMLQLSAGVAGSVALVGGAALLIGIVAAPVAVMANDAPLGALTPPHYLYSAAQSQPVETTEDQPIVIQADVDAEGRVYDYRVLTGPADQATATAIRNELMLEVFAPARVFGEPVKGQVVVTFSGVSVKG